MNKDFDYKQVPQGYLHCLNAACERSADCLRFLAGNAVDADTRSFTIVIKTILVTYS